MGSYFTVSGFICQAPTHPKTSVGMYPDYISTE